LPVDEDVGKESTPNSPHDDDEASTAESRRSSCHDVTTAGSH